MNDLLPAVLADVDYAITDEYVSPEGVLTSIGIAQPAEDYGDPRRFHVKWDGCVDYSVTSDGQQTEYLHICDLDDFIATLTAIRDVARARFGEDWPRS